MNSSVGRTLEQWPALAAIAVFSGLWFAFGVGSGWVVSRIPSDRLLSDRGLLRLRRVEHRGRIYDRVLRIRWWKDRLPDAGAWFGRDHRKVVRGFDDESLTTLAVATRRAELVHWANVAFGCSFLAWTSWRVGSLMAAFGGVVHLPFIAIQRYNRARVASILERRAARATVAEPAPDLVANGSGGSRRRTRAAFVLGLALLALGASVLLRGGPARPVTLAEARDAARVNGTSVTSPRATLVPPAGVYRYRGSGVERLSAPGGTSEQGPLIPGTVVDRGDGCWSFRVDYNSRHSQSWDYCVEGGRLLETGGASEQVLDLKVIDVTATSRTRCDPGTVAVDPDAVVGARVEQRCEVGDADSATGSVSAGTNVLVERTTIRVGGEDRDALHYRRSREITGEQRGTETVDQWFDARSGLPLRNERSVVVRTDTPLGELTYTEQGRFELESLRPT